MEKDTRASNSHSHHSDAIPALLLGTVVGAGIASKTLTPVTTTRGVALDKKMFNNIIKPDWSLDATQRHANEYKALSIIQPTAGLLQILLNQRLNQRQFDRLWARLENILCNGGSWFGQTEILAQKITISGNVCRYSEESVDNAKLGRPSGRKTQAGDIAAWNSFLSYLSFVDMDLYLMLIAQGRQYAIDNMLAAISDTDILGLYKGLYDIRFKVYENSVTRQLAWVREGAAVRNVLYDFKPIIRKRNEQV
jgi:hypothetical protein